jgi:hypothetical protein
VVTSLVVNGLFAIELVVEMITGNVRALGLKWRAVMEIICQILNFGAVISLIVNNDSVSNRYTTIKLFQVINGLRLLRLLSLFTEIEGLRLIFTTLANLRKPVTAIAIIGLINFWIFSMVGMYFFGGSFNKNTEEYKLDNSIPYLYYTMNFNCLMNSYVTLFCLSVVNNWQYICLMFVATNGYTWCTRLFFVLFYYCGVLIALNIIVAFSIDIHSAVKRMDETTQKNQKQLNEQAMFVNKWLDGHGKEEFSLEVDIIEQLIRLEKENGAEPKDKNGITTHEKQD